ncbi:uncharacterized protein LOC108867420 isoform X2 [Pyrus x bretschneideri]|uniref:uncharacterized protein LOC108867420 isoform X2 n=1 Tax=Pyrus x bretschneideri TaxID=225117 RepID=UPI00202DCF22|nr:uncharacterized protein LOC108867420 isoform X2 [Pyrus x bretschneideri]
MALQLLKLPNRTIISRRFGRATSSFSFLFSQPNLQKLPFLSSNRKVCIDGKVVNKAGTPVSDKALAQIIAEVPKYVCRAGYKLEAAIEPLFHLHSIDKLSKTCHAAMVSVMEEEATLVTLVKPQTEARRSQVGSGGVASDPLVHQENLFIRPNSPLRSSSKQKIGLATPVVLGLDAVYLKSSISLFEKAFRKL